MSTPNVREATGSGGNQACGPYDVRTQGNAGTATMSPARGQAAVQRGQQAAAAPQGQISALKVRCSHGREPGSTGVLQIVPDANQGSSTSITLGPVELSGTRERGGTDTLTVEVESRDGREEGRKQTCKRTPSARPPESAWQDGRTQDYDVDAPANDQRWPARVSPTRCHVFGRGADDSYLSHVIEVFPSQQHEYAVNVDLFADWVEEIEDQVKSKLGRTFGPITVEPQVEGPRGSLQLKWGWKENADDWRALYAVEVEAGLDPVCGFGLEVQLSLSHIATTVGLSYLGIPANIASRLADLGREYLADINVFADVGLTLKLTGSAEVGFYHSGGMTGSAAITPDLEAEVGVGMGARLGGDAWVSVSVRGRGSTGLGFSGALEADRSGVTFNPEVRWLGISVSLEFEASAGWFSAKREATWTPIDGGPLWSPAGGPLRLIG